MRMDYFRFFSGNTNQPLKFIVRREEKAQGCRRFSGRARRFMTTTYRHFAVIPTPTLEVNKQHVGVRFKSVREKNAKHAETLKQATSANSESRPLGPSHTYLILACQCAVEVIEVTFLLRDLLHFFELHPICKMTV